MAKSTKIRKYGLMWDKNHHTDLTIELYCFLHAPMLAEEDSRASWLDAGGLRRVEHFHNAVELLWNQNPGSGMRVIRNEWYDRMIDGLVYYRYCSLAGCASCVSGDTRLLNPLTGEQPTIQELCEQEKRPTVMTLNGPVLADIPYLKGRAELFEYTLSSGAKIKVTAQHRFLTERGWRHACEVGVGEQLYGYAPFPQDSNLDSGPSDQRPDALRYSQTAVDSLSCYSSCSRLCGEQLPQARESAVEPPPSPDGAQICNEYVFSHWDAPFCESKRSRPCLQSTPSKGSVFLRKLLKCIPSQSHSSQGTSSPQHPLFQRFSQFLQETLHSLTSQEQAQRSGRTECMDCVDVPSEGCPPQPPSNVASLSLGESQACQQPGECCCAQGKDRLSASCCSSSCGLKVALVEVVSITNLGLSCFYDLNVPKEHHYFAEGTVNHNSGKSLALAVYGIVNYLAAPTETKVLFTSTTLAAAQMRVWKCVSELWLPSFPGKMVQSKCLVRGLNKYGKFTEVTGLKLLAATGSATDDIDDGFIGIKAPRVIGCFDELSALTHGVLNACKTNLQTNPLFEFKAASNPDLYTDPFGTVSEPKDGWDSVDEGMMEWITERGICLRFDSEQSPNIEAGFNKYPWLPKPEDIEAARKDYGERSRFFFRMFKGMWLKDASDETVYTEGEWYSHGGARAITQDEFDGKDPQEVGVIGFDPSYVSGGDRFIGVRGRVVKIKGKSVLEVLGSEIVKDNIDSEHANRTYHSVAEMQRMSDEFNIDPENVAFDMTGAGIPFRDVVVSQWSSLPLGVHFGGTASDMQISPVDRRSAKEVYYNRVSELWVRAKGLLREGRIRGLSQDLITEICQRRWHKSNSKKLRIESKVEMKKRGLRSPDEADSFFVLLELVIRRGLMWELETIQIDLRHKDAWQESADKFNIEMHSDLMLEFD